MRNAIPSLAAFFALLITTAVIADPTLGNGDAAMLAQANDGTRSIAASGFEENKGQVHTKVGEPAPFVRYRLHKGNTSIFLLGNGIAYQFNRTHYPEGFVELMNQREHGHGKETQLDGLRAQVRVETYRMDMMLEGADPDPRITAEGSSTDYTNYYTHDALDVRTYSRITYHDVYPGINWVIYATEQGLKYDFLVHPGADPSRIHLLFKDHEELHLDDTGRLIHGNRMGRFTEESPVSFQDGKEVPTHFVLEGDHLAFALDGYDSTRTLTIDPARIWGTYYGGTGFDEGYSSAVDPSGNVYMAGYTESSSGIASGGHQNTIGGFWDAFLVKFDPAGTRLWGTFYGGTGFDYGYSCAVDPSGNVYLVGYTYSTSGIASGGHQNTFSGYEDAYVVKFDPAGTRLWSSYYGGTGNDYGYSCAVDPSGNVYLAGTTDSTSGIASGGHQDTFGGGTRDAFLVKFDPAGTRLWGTYYGGTNEDEGYSCAVDPSGNVYLSGFTYSSSAIASGGHQNTSGGDKDAFLVKFDLAGTRLWGTYYGGTDWDDGYSCAVDPSGNVYLTGETNSPSGIASAGHQNIFGGNADAFLVKFDPVGTRLWSSYYGGTGYDYGTSCAVDPSGNVYLAGHTYSTSSVASGGLQNTFGGGSDAFLVKFDSVGTRLWGTYYGGTGFDGGYSCAVDHSDNVYLAGYTNSPAGIASGGHQNTTGGLKDAFLVKFDGTSVGIPLYGGPGTTAAMFPNPTSGRFMINTTRTGQRYAITDVAGRAVLGGEVLSRSTDLDLSSEPAGVYLLKVWDRERTEVIRIVRE